MLAILVWYLLHVCGAQYPQSFDLRTKYPQCETLATATDQGVCNSCWAMASTAVFSDNLCIATQGRFNEFLSFEDTLSCVTSSFDGCTGMATHLDNLLLASLFEKDGIATNNCWPYNGQPQNQLCSQSTCPNGNVPKKHYFAKNVHSVTPYLLKPQTEIEITKYLYLNGSAWARFSASDGDMARFKTYNGNSIFECLDSPLFPSNIHYIRLIGWGQDIVNGVVKDYWLGVNSWGNKWGSNGFVKIGKGPYGVSHFGTCGIQAAVWSLEPKTDQTCNQKDYPQEYCCAASPPSILRICSKDSTSCFVNPYSCKDYTKGICCVN